MSQDFKHTALLVIDMQKDFYDSEGGAAKRGKLVASMQAVAKKTDNLIQKYGDRFGLVVFTKYISSHHLERRLTPNPYWRATSDKLSVLNDSMTRSNLNFAV